MSEYQHLLSEAQERVFTEMTNKMAGSGATTLASLEGRPYTLWPKPKTKAQRMWTEAKRRIINAWYALNGAYLDGE